MENRFFDNRNGLWYEKQGDYYLLCLELPKEENQPIGYQVIKSQTEESANSIRIAECGFPKPHSAFSLYSGKIGC